MGSSTQEIVYSVPVNLKSEKTGQSKIYRHPQSVVSLIEVPQKGLNTLQDIWNDVVKNHGKLSYLGYQVKKGQKIQYQYQTYSQVDKIVRKLGSAIKNENLLTLVSEGQINLQVIGIFSKNRKEWLYADISSIVYGYQIIPLYDTLEQTQMTSCFVTQATVPTILKVKKISKLKNLIGFDKIQQSVLIAIKQKGDLIKEVKQIISPTIVAPSDCYTFSYTSGSVGFPKGAMLSHANFVAIIASFVHDKNFKLNPGDKHLSYLPLPHVMQRAAVSMFMGCGGTICFYGGDVQALKNDLPLVKPDIFVSVPRLFSRFYDVIKGKFDGVTGFKKKLIDRALQAKLDRLRRYGTCTHTIYDTLIFNQTKQAFGGKTRFMCTGSAPISPEIIQFIKIVSCTPLIQGYGQTQSTALSFATQFNQASTGHVGGPFRSLQFKVQDIPQMNYLSTDTTDGRLTPRGQICIRGPVVFMGYFRLPQKTKQAIDEKGWLHTGDVGKILPNGALKIIDRKKNIFKLQQGQYVAPQKIQNSYAKVNGISEVFLYGQSLQSYTIAVIVVEKQYINNWAIQNKVQGTHQQLCKNKNLKLKLLAQMAAQGKKDGLMGFEQAKNLYIQPTSLLQKGCMTNTLKLKRFEAKKVYQYQLKAMYKEGMLK